MERVPQLQGVTERLEEPITLAEVEQSVDDLPNQRVALTELLPNSIKRQKVAAGPFFKKYSAKHTSLKSIASVLQTSTVLIPKSDDPVKLRRVTNYRPNTLCNTDYKIFTKISGRKLHNVICDIFGEHQTWKHI